MRLNDFMGLSWAEQLEIFKDNELMQEAAENITWDIAQDDIRYWLDTMRIDGYIGDRGEYVTITDEDMYTGSFERGLYEVQNSMPLLSDSDYEQVCELIEGWHDLEKTADEQELWSIECMVYDDMDRVRRDIEYKIFESLKDVWNTAVYDDVCQLETLLCNERVLEPLLDDASAPVIESLVERYGLPLNTATNIANEFKMGLAF